MKCNNEYRHVCYKDLQEYIKRTTYFSDFLDIEKELVKRNLEIPTKFKTINGEEILGCGDITITSGDVLVDGILSLTSENPVQNKVITEALNRINNELFPLTISVSGGGLFEKRTSQNITVNWQIKEGKDIVTPDTITVNEQPIANINTSKTFNNVTTNTIYTVKATKDGTEVQGSTSAIFVNPSYFGPVAADFTITEEAIKALTKSVKNSKGYTGNVSLNNQKTCYAYPKALGALTAIKDANNFEYINSYTRSELTVWDETYYVYVLTDATTIDNFRQIYS